MEHQGMALGWHHLGGRLVERGDLVRPVSQFTVMKNRGHYVSVRKDKIDSPACQNFCAWLKQ